jgi:23S rRNA pseudouridine2605 synthase
VPVERLQKLLAGAGVASRRAAERMILDGRVRVNGRIVHELGTKADPRRDRVEVDGTRLVQEHPVYYVLHKPRGVVTTLHDPEGRPTVAELLRDVPERVFPVGRLDFHTSGVLLLTNDGELTHALLHPSRRVPRTYAVKVRGNVDAAALAALRGGVAIGPREVARPEEVGITSREGGNTWLRITLAEGRNREVHRMMEAVGQRVARLMRISFAGIEIAGLPAGAYRELTRDELRRLQKGASGTGAFGTGATGASGAQTRGLSRSRKRGASGPGALGTGATDARERGAFGARARGIRPRPVPVPIERGGRDRARDDAADETRRDASPRHRRDARGGRDAARERVGDEARRRAPPRRGRDARGGRRFS